MCIYILLVPLQPQRRQIDKNREIPGDAQSNGYAQAGIETGFLRNGVLTDGK